MGNDHLPRRMLVAGNDAGWKSSDTIKHAAQASALPMKQAASMFRSASAAALGHGGMHLRIVLVLSMIGAAPCMIRFVTASVTAHPPIAVASKCPKAYLLPLSTGSGNVYPHMRNKAVVFEAELASWERL